MVRCDAGIWGRLDLESRGDGRLACELEVAREKRRGAGLGRREKIEK